MRRILNWGKLHKHVRKFSVQSVQRANRPLETGDIFFAGNEKVLHRPVFDHARIFLNVIKKPLTIDAGWMNSRCSQVRIQVNANYRPLVRSITFGSVD
jgi:hypothetical protein